jgi:phosphatidylglycerophosphate synthase
MPAERRITLADCLRCRAAQAFWFTYRFSHPPGMFLAWLFTFTRVTPNQVTLLSLVFALGGPVYVAFTDHGRLVESLILFGTLHLGYFLDCADGVLARVTKTGSRFGQMFDKIVDAIVAMALPGVLYWAALGQPSPWLPTGAIFAVCLLTIFSRTILSINIWIKELLERGGDRTVQDTRVHNLKYYLRRAVGHSTDTALFYTLVPIAWGLGWIWEFLAAYSIWMLVIWAGYLRLSYSDLRSSS